jgi:hypothetical protein
MKKVLKFAFLTALLLWAEAALASRSQGHLGFFGLGKETTFGTAVTVTDYMELLSENLSTGIDRFPTRNIFGGFYEPDDYAGMRRTAGGIVHAAHPVSVGHLLKAAFNNISQSVILSGSLWNLHFTGLKSEFADGVPLQPYTLEVNRNISSGSHRYAGALLNRLTLALAPNQDLRCTAEWIAKARSAIAASTFSFPGSSTDPFTFDTASVQIAGAANTRLEAFQMVIDNQLEGISVLNASSEIERIRAQGPQMIRISGTLDFVNNAEELDFVNQNERALIITMTRAQSFALHLEVPRFVYSSFPLGAGGRGRNVIAFDGMARYRTASLAAVRVMLTTTKSNY